MTGPVDPGLRQRVRWPAALLQIVGGTAGVAMLAMAAATALFGVLRFGVMVAMVVDARQSPDLPVLAGVTAVLAATDLGRTVGYLALAALGALVLRAGARLGRLEGRRTVLLGIVAAFLIPVLASLLSCSAVLSSAFLALMTGVPLALLLTLPCWFAAVWALLAAQRPAVIEAFAAADAAS